jgi:3-oxoacid CoA-transferase
MLRTFQKLVPKLSQGNVIRTTRLESASFSTKAESKIYDSTKSAIHDIGDNASVILGGFGVAGAPENAIHTIAKKGIKNLTFISNTAGMGDFIHGIPIGQKQVKKIMASYTGECPPLDKEYLGGIMEIEFVPQGTLAERLRAGGAGIPAFFTPTGTSTNVEHGYPLKCGKEPKDAELSEIKERREFDGRQYLLEPSIKADFGIVKAHKADKKGNLRFRKTARNFNPDVAGCAKITIAEVEEIVDSLPPEQVHLSGCFIDRVYKGEINTKKIERLKLSKAKGEEKETKAISKRERIIQRAVYEFEDGMYANLGIGIPTLAASFVEGKMEVNLQGENGILGIGPYPTEAQLDCDLINAGKETITSLPFSSYFRSSDSFGMMRGKHLHLTMLGGLEVSQNADLANWIIPGKKVNGMGGMIHENAMQIYLFF